MSKIRNPSATTLPMLTGWGIERVSVSVGGGVIVFVVVTVTASVNDGDGEPLGGDADGASDTETVCVTEIVVDSELLSE